MTKYTVGQVTWFNDVKGFGYLKENGEASGRDVFVHYTAINIAGFKTLSEGQWVAFYLIEGPKGPQASGVIPCDSEQAAVDIAMSAERIASLAAMAEAVEAIADPVNEEAAVDAVVAEELSNVPAPTEAPAPAKKRKVASSRWHWSKSEDGQLRTTVKIEARLTKHELQAWQDYAAHHREEFTREWLEGELSREVKDWPTFVDNMVMWYSDLAAGVTTEDALPSTEVLHA